MNSNIFLFRLYVCFALCFLLPVSFFLTGQLYSFVQTYLQLKLCSKLVKEKSSLDQTLYTELLDLYINRDDWFLCISISELLLEFSLMNNDQIYSSLAYCYQKNSFLDIAEYYYLKALSFSPSNIPILLRLIDVYNQLGSKEKLKKLHYKIKLIDPSYVILHS
uniref:Uncharacterized protein n=1 Tax=Rhodomela confervoides TaxID=35163 RepID=A0A1Z1M9L0_RHOCN|nr:hypothetical protein [Rhodomela confervoides]ARW62593.1 hypothetical protein [Rhodomela confervoides]